MASTSAFVGSASIELKTKFTPQAVPHLRNFCFIGRNISERAPLPHQSRSTRQKPRMADDSPKVSETSQVASDAAESPKPTIDELFDSAAASSEARETVTQKPQYTLRARLREETEAPFRKARMFVYAGSALSAGVGAFIAGLRVVAGLSGISGVQPLNETVPNVAINLGVIGVCVLLLRFETKAGERRLARMSRGARIASLRIEDAVTRQVLSLKDLRGRTRVVLVAGTGAKVAEAMKRAEDVKDGISEANLLIVPFITEDGEQENLRNWRMNPYATDEWQRWFEGEREAAKARLDSNSSEVLVIVVRLDGRVGARSVGAPMWPKLVDEVSKLPRRDKYGKP